MSEYDISIGESHPLIICHGLEVLVGITALSGVKAARYTFVLILGVNNLLSILSITFLLTPFLIAFSRYPPKFIIARTVHSALMTLSMANQLILAINAYRPSEP